MDQRERFGRSHVLGIIGRYVIMLPISLLVIWACFAFDPIDKPSGDGESLVKIAADLLGRDNLDKRENCLSFAGSRFDNLRKGMWFTSLLHSKIRMVRMQSVSLFRWTVLSLVARSFVQIPFFCVLYQWKLWSASIHFNESDHMLMTWTYLNLLSTKPGWPHISRCNIARNLQLFDEGLINERLLRVVVR